MGSRSATIVSSRGARLALWLLWICQASACRTNSPTQREELCRRACKGCAEACASLVAQAERAGCAEQQAAYFACLARGDGPAELGALEGLDQKSLRQSGCVDVFAAQFSCMRPCRERGVVAFGSRPIRTTGRARTVIAEQVSLGCERPEPELQRGAPAGSPCEHSSVCAATRCPCGAGELAYSARACVDGRCAGASEACELVPRAVDLHACPGPGPRP